MGGWEKVSSGHSCILRHQDLRNVLSVLCPSKHAPLRPSRRLVGYTSRKPGNAHGLRERIVEGLARDAACAADQGGAKTCRTSKLRRSICAAVFANPSQHSDFSPEQLQLNKQRRKQSLLEGFAAGEEETSHSSRHHGTKDKPGRELSRSGKGRSTHHTYA